MRRPLFFSFFLVILVAWTFRSVQTLPFLNFDDDTHVSKNQYMHPVTPARLWFYWRYPFDPTPLPKMRSQAGGLAPPYEQIYAPLAFTTWAMLTFVARETPTTALPPDQYAPLDPSIYHSFNLLLHVGNTLLVFLLLRRLTRSDWGALAGALLFGLHPVQVEAVAWVTGMNNLLAAVLCLGALHLYLSHLENIKRRNADSTYKTPLRFLVGSTLLFGLAMLAKPSSAPLPAIALLLCWLVGVKNWRIRLLEMAPWGVLVLASLIINRSLQTEGTSAAAVAPYLRPFLIGDAFAFYCAKILWPLGLTTDYARKPHWILSNWWGYATWIAPASFVALVIWQLKKGPIEKRETWRRILTGFLIFALTVLPMSGIVTYYFHLISTVADRYLYIASLGFALALAAPIAFWESSTLFRKQTQGYFLKGTLAVVSLGWVFLSNRQIEHWKSDEALWSHCLEVSPRSATAHLFAGYMAQVAGNSQEALRILEDGTTLEPNNWRIWSRIAAVRGSMGDKVGAEKAYLMSQSFYPDHYLAHLQLGQIYVERKDYEKAIQQFGAGVKIRPDSAEMLANFGVTAGKMGNPQVARHYLEKALQQGFDPGAGHLYLGVALAMEGKKEEALSHWMQSLLVKPNFYETHYNVGLYYLGKKEYRKAAHHFRRALAANLTYAPAYFNLGVTLQKQGEKKAAEKNFRVALKLDPNFQPAIMALKQLAKFDVN